MTDLPFTLPDPDPSRPERKPAKCKTHRWATFATPEADDYFSDAPRWETRCDRCGKTQDKAATRRAHSSIDAGKRAERAIAKAYPGGVRTGHHGGPDDVIVGDLFIIQSKAGGWFSERVWAELVKLPRTGGRIPTLIVSDRPGPGHRTRRYVVRSLDDDIALHGPTGGTE